MKLIIILSIFIWGLYLATDRTTYSRSSWSTQCEVF